MVDEYQLEVGDKKIEVSIDKLAEQANGSVFVKIGETLVLATATMSSFDLKNLDFFPLTVEYQEKFYAAGKILGSRFMRREGRPSDGAILTSRLIDRTIRPLFPKGLKREVQVIITCFSFDEKNDPDIAGIIAASMALGISDIPWQGPVAGLRTAKKTNEEIMLPTYEEREKAAYETTICALQEQELLINMLEADANEIEEAEILETIAKAKPELEKIVAFEKKIIKEKGKAKIKIEEESFPEIDSFIKDNYKDKLEKAMYQSSTVENKKTMQELLKEIEEKAEEKFGEEKVSYSREIIEQIFKEILTYNVLQYDKRPDSRKLDEIRPIDSENNVLPRAHGSAIFLRGKTKSLSIVTLGSPGDQKLIDAMEFQGKKGFMHHYNFPPYCSGEVKFLRGPGRREIGHGALAEKALLPIIPNSEDFPYTIRVVTEIFSSNGSTSMASVSSSSLALMDAGVPIKRPAAGIAMGIIQEDNNYKLLTDIQGPEDHFGGMDFKVAGTDKGITAIQLDVKIKGLNQEIISQTLEAAKKARKEILAKTAKTLNEPKKEISPLAPRIFQTKIDKNKIGLVIGSGGKTINEIIEQCEVEIDIEDDGNVFIAAENQESAQKAIDWINSLTREVEVGEIYEGEVKKILDFGAFVEILPGKDGLVHISQLSEKHIKEVGDILKIGDIIPVKVISIDKQGRINLSLKEAKKS
jgi:polyribonucleotide nucleotidyltransferase